MSSSSNAADTGSSSQAVSTSSVVVISTSSTSAQQSTASSQAQGTTTTAAAPATTIETTEQGTPTAVTSTETAPTQQATTNIVSSVETISSQTTPPGANSPTVVVITSTGTVTSSEANAASSSASSSSSATAISNGGDKGKSGGSGKLGTGGITAIAVVIPIAVIALLVGLGIWYWRRRKSQKEVEEQRRKEVEDYSYNPNGDPTLPAVGSEAPQMAEDANSGYRGWGTTTTSNRKASTNMSGGHTQQLSDSGNSYGAPVSPSGNHSDGHSSDPLVHNRDTMNSDDLGALGVAPAAAAGNQGGIRRGPSNASSAYSAGGRSDHSDDIPPVPAPNQQYDYNPGQGYGYSQHGPYGDGTYGGGQDPSMPVVRDLNARRNTQIRPGGAYQQGNSGIAQNF